MKARNLIHARIEENIRAKICGLRAAEAGAGYKDALQLLIEHSWERGERLDMQVRRLRRGAARGLGLPVFPVPFLGPQSAGLGPSLPEGAAWETPRWDAGSGDTGEESGEGAAAGQGAPPSRC